MIGKEKPPFILAPMETASFFGASEASAEKDMVLRQAQDKFPAGRVVERGEILVLLKTGIIP